MLFRMSASPISDVRSRAIEARDILSSFDRDKLPQEILGEGLFENIEPYRRSEDRTRIDDLLGSLFQHAAHDDAFFRELCKMQSESTRLRLFYEKVSRRLKQAFARYDELFLRVQNAWRALTTEEEQEFNKIPTTIQYLVEAVNEDLRHRQSESAYQQATRITIEALEGVCRRHDDVSRVTRSHQARVTSLFQILIGTATTNFSSDFGINVLKRIPSGILNSFQMQLNGVQGLLVANSTHPGYMREFEHLR
jgi:hypothetical protein